MMLDHLFCGVGLFCDLRICANEIVGSGTFASGGVHSRWRELLFGKASQADCALREPSGSRIKEPGVAAT